MTARVSGRSESCDSARRFCRTDLVDDTGTYTGTGSYEVTRDFVVIKYSTAQARDGIYSVLNTASGGHPGFIEP